MKKRKKITLKLLKPNNSERSNMTTIKNRTTALKNIREETQMMKKKTILIYDIKFEYLEPTFVKLYLKRIIFFLQRIKKAYPDFCIFKNKINILNSLI